MSYDPNETRVMPRASTEFPITDELPAVGARPRGTPPWLTAALLIGLLVAAGIVLAVAFILQNREESVTTVAPTAVEVDPSDPPVFVQPTAVTTSQGDPGYWQIVGVDEGLNVRSGPGTSNDVVGALTAGTRHVFSTGEQANVNGATWQKITFGESDTTGWVSARFLAPDTAPDPNATPVPAPTVAQETGVSVVCFQAPDDPTRIARIVFTNGTQISGFVEADEGRGAFQRSVDGELDRGTAQVTLTNEVSGETILQRWTFNATNVVTSDGTRLSVVNCSSIGLN